MEIRAKTISWITVRLRHWIDVSWRQTRFEHPQHKIDKIDINFRKWRTTVCQTQMWRALLIKLTRQKSERSFAAAKSSCVQKFILCTIKYTIVTITRDWKHTCPTHPRMVKIIFGMAWVEYWSAQRRGQFPLYAVSIRPWIVRNRRQLNSGNGVHWLDPDFSYITK